MDFSEHSMGTSGGAVLEYRVDQMEKIGGQKFSEMLFSVKKPLENFQKTRYEPSFQAYYEKHADVLHMATVLYQKAADAENIYQRWSAQLIDNVKKHMQELKKRKADNLLTDYNMTLVIYLFPALLKYDKSAGKMLSEVLLTGWKAAFPQTNLKAATYETIVAGFKKHYCYITTAVCRSLGKPEDCSELTLLRKFRDEYMQQSEEGEKCIQEYYNIAPSIVKSIDKLPNSDEIYFNIWKKYLAPCIEDIKNKRQQECMVRYTEMVYDLQRKFFLMGER